MKKNIVTSITIGLMTFANTVSTAAASFIDVPSDHPQAKVIDSMQYKKVIRGYPDNTFKPDKPVTKAEFYTMLFNDVGYTADAVQNLSPFDDVPEKSWFAPYVQKALDTNIISATGIKPTFNPEGYITRANAMKAAFQIGGISAPYYTDINPLELYQDVQPGAWYAYLARAAKLNNITYLKDPDYFYGNHVMTRGDTAELLEEIDVARNYKGESTTGYPVTITVNQVQTQSGPVSTDKSTVDLMSNPKFGIFMNVWKEANTNYYYKSKLNQDQLIYGAIKGMVDKLDDEYTTYYEPDEAKGLLNYLSGNFDGIGTVLTTQDGEIIITKVLPNSPAEKAGLKSSDMITKIDNNDVQSMSIDQATTLIKGTAGTSVHLTINRSGQSIIFDLIRASVHINSVEGKMINGNAYISISEFGDSTGDELSTVLNTLNSQAPRGYILDLRDNPGGYFNKAVDVLGHFVSKGTIVSTIKYSDGTSESFTTDGQGELKGKPLFILVNKNTASAAEITAGALQDLKIGKLIGTTTFGKGSVQEMISPEPTDGSLLKMTTAHWFTPANHDITGQGLSPDINVELDQSQLANGVDTQLQKAINQLAS